MNEDDIGKTIPEPAIRQLDARLDLLGEALSVLELVAPDGRDEGQARRP
ncbi:MULTISPECIES: hypothetical protein [Streptomyces]|uniref:Uncharacterized protein n=1 Tax=Streptomyces antimycoticus TaxID=68175 RepID=A0ABD5JFS8_9ACTN|nr:MULTISPECIES: hypothetical protein [Streptomyces]MEE4587263.1 hypothetical protein [Streptomyces sp. DSM 41602]QTI90286.1 hypothetical protein AS97_58895 [Streptomyces sp. AgN23]WTA86409.1 hypothetical protein OG751_44800 [Streptomyces antimycoticus]